MAVAIRIPFNRPTHVEGVKDALMQAVQGGHTAGGGPFGRKCEDFLSAMFAQSTLLVSSCTHALEMSALLLEIQPGDEVILPSFTFVSTANAFALRGADLKFADCDDYGNIDLGHLERLLSPKTRVVVPVHYAGNSCDMKQLMELCRTKGVPVAEDAAQSVGAYCHGRPLGTFGALGSFSFHETKNLVSGEGGALTSVDENMLTRAHHLRDKGTNRREFRNGLADKYSWVDIGSSWAMSDLNAAYLSAQLDRFKEIAARRKALWLRYESELAAPAMKASIRTLKIPPHNLPNHHLFALILRSRDQRDRFISFMGERGILTPFHYVSLHSSPYGRQFHKSGEPLPKTDELSDCLVRLPLFYNLTGSEQADVIESATKFLNGEK